MNKLNEQTTQKIQVQILILTSKVLSNQAPTTLSYIILSAPHKNSPLLISLELGMHLIYSVFIFVLLQY